MTDQPQGRPAFELLDEAFHLLRQAPVRALASYYLGSVPFVLGLIYFWGDMSKSAFARHNLAPAALGLALLFIWMKTWQSVYARYLYADVSGTQPARLTLRHVARVAVRQTIIQPLGLLVLPVCLVFGLPFPWAYATYQNASVLDDGHTHDVQQLFRKARDLSKLWPRQNAILIWALSPFLLIAALIFHIVITPIVAALTPDITSSLMGFYGAVFALAVMPLSPFGAIVAANIAAALQLGPMLLHMLLGIQTMFIQNPFSFGQSSTYIVIAGLTYLCMDPLMKAAYVLRCYYGESVQTGADLRLKLRHHALSRKTLALILVCGLSLICSGGAIAEEAEATEPVAVEEPAPTPLEFTPSVEPDTLSAALADELQRPQYAWRMPRVTDEAPPDNIFTRTIKWIQDKLHAGFDWVKRQWKKVEKWLDKVAKSHDEESESGSALWVDLLLYALLAIVLSIVAITAYRLWKLRVQQGPVVAAAGATPVTPDLEDESTTADALSQDGWLEMANEAAARGDLRLALRALFLAGISHLAHQNMVQIAKGKSNRDYARELERRAHAEPHLLDAFVQNMTIYEAIWYGLHETTQDLFNCMKANMERLRRCGQA